MAGCLRALILARSKRKTTGEVIRMAKVSIRVRSGAARSDVADSAQQRVSLVRRRYRNCDVRIKSLSGLADISAGGPVPRMNDLSDALVA